MDHKKLLRHKCEFIRAFNAVISECGKEPELVEAVFTAYASPNSLIRFLVWRRLVVTINFLEARGPYDAILDFGCGSCVILPLLREFTNRIVGVDSNLNPYNLLSSHLTIPKDIEVYKTQEKPILHFPDETFNAIICLDVLEHIEDLPDVFGELCRITKPGGRIIVSGPTESFFYRVGRKIAGKEYTGDYHIRNIYDVRKVVERFVQTKTLATLYYPFPLFKIFVGQVAS